MTRTCALCGREGSGIRSRLVRWRDDWREALGRGSYSFVDRCDDREACRRRGGEDWPADEPAARTGVDR